VKYVEEETVAYVELQNTAITKIGSNDTMERLISASRFS
jgi:hypothetical protein